MACSESNIHQLRVCLEPYAFEGETTNGPILWGWLLARPVVASMSDDPTVRSRAPSNECNSLA